MLNTERKTMNALPTRIAESPYAKRQTPNTWYFFGVCSVVVLGMISCNSAHNTSCAFPTRKSISPKFNEFRQPISQTELNMINSGLVNVQDLDSTIVVDIRYATTNNIVGKDIYGGLTRAYLQPEVAQMLVKAQQFIKKTEPEYSIIVFDAARPRSAQQELWDAVDAPFTEKIKFLANPANGSIHNFGAAVDVGLVDIYGILLDMGTDYDYMGELAYPVLEQQMIQQGQLQPFQAENRKLLRKAMRQAGFWGIQTEWWHFNACSRAEARERYSIIE